MGNWQEARTVAALDKQAPGHIGFAATSTVSASARASTLHPAPHCVVSQAKSDFGTDSVDQSKSKHFASAHAPEAEGQLNVAAWPRSKDSLFANGDCNERYLATSTDLM
jgi:hypothetical protein